MQAVFTQNGNAASRPFNFICTRRDLRIFQEGLKILSGIKVIRDTQTHGLAAGWSFAFSQTDPFAWLAPRLPSSSFGQGISSTWLVLVWLFPG